ncbi:BT4734/BF3469 family protein, partial [Parabacteroides distasonis]
TGIKLLVPYRLSIKKTVEESFDEAVRFAWEYLEWKYGLKADATNADLSRACFLCHDPSARLGDRNC